MSSASETSNRVACPAHASLSSSDPSSRSTSVSLAGRIREFYSRLHRWGTRYLGRLWLLQYVGPAFPGVVAHHRPLGLEGFLVGHSKSFHRATVIRGEPASSYFRTSGISECAEKNGGLCSFRMGATVALYQIDNAPRVPDDVLAPSLDANKELFGEFMGSLQNENPARREKRLAVETTLGNSKFIDDLEPAIRRHTQKFLSHAQGQNISLDDFALNLVAYVDSFVPGVLDLTQRPLNEFLSSIEYSRVARDFFEVASDVIANVDASAIEDSETIVPFVRTLLKDNFESIAAAPATNMIRRYFVLWNRPFTQDAIAHLEAAKLKELGTIIVATYDTTYLSLLWAIGHIESNRELKDIVSREARKRPANETFSVLDLIVLEAVRLEGSNPTALWRRVVKPFRLSHRGRVVNVPPGVMLWLDRRLANQDPTVFPRPCVFDIQNIKAILKSDRETFSSLLSRGRYEINSFSMVNTERNPRKCPGRLFSVRVQSILLAEIYSAYEVTTCGIDLRLKNRSSMPRPTQPGTIRITVSQTSPGEIQ